MGVTAEPSYSWHLSWAAGAGTVCKFGHESLDRYAPVVSRCDSDSRGSSRSTRQIIAYRTVDWWNSLILSTVGI